jgi:hypothetical protein
MLRRSKKTNAAAQHKKTQCCGAAQKERTAIDCKVDALHNASGQ